MRMEHFDGNNTFRKNFVFCELMFNLNFAPIAKQKTSIAFPPKQNLHRYGILDISSKNIP